MPSSLALLLCLILLMVLYRFDPAKDSGKSLALWVPLIWMFIAGSRLPSQWLGGKVGMSAQALEEGNQMDRSILLILILLAIGILTSRSFKWSAFFARNVALTAFLCFALLSVLWSDFFFVAFKRWFRDLGNYLVILVVLSDARPLEAVNTLLRRLCFLLVLLSVVLVKYFPEIAKQYDSWTGVAAYAGVATSKNMLGLMCLISGLFFFWDTITRWPERGERQTNRIILVNIAFFAMTLWLLNLARSATSMVCLVLGCMVIMAARSGAFQRHPRFLKALVPACFCLYLLLAFGLDINARLADVVGRDATLTDRTKIWALLLSMHTNPIVGTGYQSFWLGHRIESVSRSFGWINEAHNGYLEVYLNLGLIGLFLLVGFLVAGYRNICSRLASDSSFASFTLAAASILIFYNMTEAAFQVGLPWMMFLLGAIVLPEPAKHRVHSVAAFGKAGVTGRLPGLPSETKG